jgi:hypothetical protein
VADRDTPTGARVRIGICFGAIDGKRFLNDELPFDGTPAGFDDAIEKLRVAFHEKAEAEMRPCGHPGPWHETAAA